MRAIGGQLWLAERGGGEVKACFGGCEHKDGKGQSPSSDGAGQ